MEEKEKKRKIKTEKDRKRKKTTATRQDQNAAGSHRGTVGATWKANQPEVHLTRASIRRAREPYLGRE